MKNKLKARTPILALILFVFAVGYTFAANKVVVIPMAGDPAPQSLAVFATGSAETLTTALTALTSVSMTAPSNGIVIVNSTAQASETTAGDGVQ